MKTQKIGILMIMMLLVVGVVSATHDPIITMSPDIANCGNLGNTFTVNVENDISVDGAHDIFEVRIYSGTAGIVDFACGAAPVGWTLSDYAGGDPNLQDYGYCEYKTSWDGNAVIVPGDDLDFTFDAVMTSAEECGSQFLISTLDNNRPIGEHEYTSPEVKIDCAAPYINKMIGDPKIPLPNGGPNDFWITQDTLLTAFASDNLSVYQCDLGLDYCEITYTVDDGDLITEVLTDSFEPETFDWSYEWMFGEDSQHWVNITCYDKAGNSETLTEMDKVDDTEPETTKEFTGPMKEDDGVEWIDSVTELTLNPVDPDPTGYQCNVGVDKTWYKISMDESEDACWFPDKYCNAESLKTITPYDVEEYDGCIDEVQKECSTGGEREFDDWYDCVEQMSYRRCGISDEWKLFRPDQIISDIEESCHVMEYFSIDHLGNQEDVQTNCFFVDKTPPKAEKWIGEPTIIEMTPLVDDEEMYVVKIMNPTDDEVEAAVAFEGLIAGWEGVTNDDVCFAFSEDISYYYDAYHGSCEGLNGNGCGPDTVDQTWAEWLVAHPDWMDWYSTEADCAYPGGDEFPVLTWDDGQIVSPQTIGAGETAWAIVRLEFKVADTYRFTMESEGFDIYHGAMPESYTIWAQDHVTPVELSCVDQEPHPSRDEEVCFQVTLDDVDDTSTYCTGDGAIEAITDEGYEGDWCCDAHAKTLVFMEDSNHDVDYFCRDAVNKKSERDLEHFKVDSIAPEISKDMFGTFDGDCPVGTDLDHGDCYVKGTMGDAPSEGGVTISAIDPDTTGEDCAVNDVMCHYNVWWDVDRETCGNDGEWVDEKCYVQEGSFTDTVNVSFYEDSTHGLYVYCEDSLGNWADDEEFFLVDMTPPVTTKTYGEPAMLGEMYPKGCIPEQVCEPGALCAAQALVACDGDCPVRCQEQNFITSATPITLEEEDEKIGTDFTEYRVSGALGENICANCDGWMQALRPDIGPWNTYSDPFTIPEDSCHVIEYRSTDLFGNVEDIKWQCVFVDNKEPSLIKEIGEPKLIEEMVVDTGDVCDGPAPGACADSKTYTLDADFDEGVLNGVEHDTTADQLQLVIGEVTALPLLWVANAAESTLSKWDTETNKEVARYHTWFGPKLSYTPWSGPAPSRTAVDTDGNVFVANRQFPSNKKADVFKIFADDWIDRNGNGVLDTSTDANNDGVIDASEMMQFTDDNNNGIIDDDEITDERVAWVVEVGTNNCLGRSLAIDLDGNIWLGCYNERTYYKIDGDDGSLLLGPISVGNSPYGALVDKQGILWGASLGSTLLRLDTSDGTNQVISHSQWGSNYGIALGYDDQDNTIVYLGSGSGHTFIKYETATATFSTPAAIKYAVRGVATDLDGNVVAGAASNAVINLGGAAKFAPDGTLIWKAASQVGASETRGTVVASDGDVWLVHVSSDEISKVDGTDGSPLGVFAAGKGPYTYSDATGLGLRGTVNTGTWRVVHDSGAVGSAWGVVSWTDDVPADTSLTVRARSSEDQLSWSSWEVVASGVPLGSTPDGRYMQVEVTMKSTTDASPVLYDLTVDGDCGDVVCEEDELVNVTYVNRQTPITMTCDDRVGDHPVDHVELFWHYRYNDDCDLLYDEKWSETDSVTALDLQLEDMYSLEHTIYFEEDSCHELEYWCEDALGNLAGPFHEYDIVDTQAPDITTGIEGPSIEIEGDVFIDGVTNITVNAVDPLPHPVNDVWCEWAYKVNPKENKIGLEGENTPMQPPFKVNFPEESQHMLHIECWDALGNRETLEEMYFVDKTAPGIDKWYGEPHHPVEGLAWDPTQTFMGEWISVETPIYGKVTDDGPHKSGIAEVKYRVSLVNDSYCEYYDEDDFACEDATGDGDWMIVDAEDYDEFEFNISKESCHLIEIYAVDEVEKDALHKQCVFVDDTAPDTDKTIGEPKDIMSQDNRDQGAFYYPELIEEGFCDEIDQNGNPMCSDVTLLTPINLGCTDPVPHPSGAVDICFNVDFDGLDVTGDYCPDEEGVEMVDGYCCMQGPTGEFRFVEESWHKLSYYCVDEVGNVGEPDVEYFKVEGTAFEIQLNYKWNLISTPVQLLDDSIGAVFDSHNESVVSVWTQDADKNWYVYTPDGVANDNIHQMLPGWGYWVFTNMTPGETDLLTIGGSLFMPGPAQYPGKDIGPGYNLIGYYGGTDLAPEGSNGFPGYYGPAGNGNLVMEEICSLTPTQNDRGLSGMWSYWAGDGFAPMGPYDRMDPGAGYLVNAYDGILDYTPGTMCGFGQPFAIRPGLDQA